jgi:RNA polymerase sigma-70 factor (ECF subfamily)
MNASTLYAPASRPTGSAIAGAKLDIELVRRAQTGDHDAFGALAQLNARKMYGVAIRILGSPPAAEDAVQDALVEVWQDLRGLRDPERFGSWAMRILVRVAHRHAGRNRGIALLPFETVTVSVADRDQYAGLADRDLLERAFRRVTVDQRTILVLRFHLGLEPAEIAEVLGIAQGTARSRLHYALDALRGALEADARRSETSLEVLR